MSEALSPIDKAKAAAAQAAAGLVKDGMRVGLGTGSTAAWLVRALGGRVRHEGLRLTGVPTSERTAALAREAGIPLADLDGAGWLDLTIDGADEVDGQLNLIKGGGGALLREKIVATASERVVIIADAGKRVGTLGACPLPVEVVPFGWSMTCRLVEEALAGLDLDGREARLRLDGGEPFVTDGGHLILDLHLGRIGQPRQLGLVLNQIPGVVESGLFVDICDALVLGHADGRVEVQDPSADAARDLAQGLGTKGPAPDNIFTDVAD